MNPNPIVSVSLAILIFLVSSYAEKAPYTSFAKNATSAPATEHYDYIVIGGGTAGCPLAATLSATAKVLLLERGGLPYDNPNVTHADGFFNTLMDTSPDSASQPFISTDGVFNNRGRILGGGSALNAGFYTRASDEYVSRAGWDPRLVNESYEWVERKVAFRPRLTPWMAAVRDGLLDAGVLPDNGFTFEHLVGTKVGGSIIDENGTRHTSADLLEYANSSNIVVYLHATVYQILFNTTSPGKRAYAVLFKDSKGNNHTAMLNNGPRNEIIVSAGALGSPVLLMLSGIGPGPKLMARGIDVVMDQPMVGQGMSDNPLNWIFIPSHRAVKTTLAQVVGITNFSVYVESIAGPLKFSTDQDMNSSEFGNETSIIGHRLIGGKVGYPYSRGYLELNSTDPNDNPTVTFNYFNDSRDVDTCVQGLKVTERVVESRPISSYRDPNSSIESLKRYMLSLPINLRSRHESAVYNRAQYCKDTVVTIWHYHGGCQVDRVVDRDYRVLGVESLRVVDGSTFYDSPGTNPQATLMMLGRYVGQKILQHRRSGSD